MDPTDPLSVQTPTLAGIRTPSAGGFDLSPNELLARVIEAYPSQIYQGWQPSPPSMEDAAKAGPLMQLGLAYAYPDLFGNLVSPGLDANHQGTSNGPDQGESWDSWQLDPVGGSTFSDVATLDANGSSQSNPDGVANQVGSSPPVQSLQTAPRSYVAKPGDNISAIVGSSDPTAVGQFAIQNGLRSSTIRPGLTYTVPDPSQAPDPQASAVGQAMMDGDNARLAAAAQQRRQAAASAAGIWVSGRFYPADQMWAAVAALNDVGAPAPKDPDQAFFELQSALEEADRQSGQPKPPEGWFQKAQRNFGQAANSAGEFFGSGVQELWDDLPGLQPEVGWFSSLETAPQVGEVLVDAEPYEDLAPRLSGTGVQAHHLNQDAAYRDIIPTNRGLAVSLPGNAITAPGSSHFEFHKALEEFWDQYRSGDLKGEIPTNGQYGDALEGALNRAGVSPRQSAAWAQQAAKQRIAHGLLDADPVPRVPSRLSQMRSR